MTTAYCTPISTFASVCRVRPFLAQLLDRHELEEHVVIGHDAEQAVARVFGGDEPFRAGVDLAVLDGVAADLLLEQIAERVELRAAVDDQPQVGPHLRDGLLAGRLLEPVEEHAASTRGCR